MPFCPECLSEYREGFTRCASCDVELVSELPREMELSEENVAAALAGRQLVPVARGELEVVKETRSLLARARIASLIVEDEETKLPPGMPPRVILVVAEADQERAAEVLGDKFREMVQAEGVPVDAVALEYGKCPACGTQIAEDAEECPECGLFLGGS